MSILEWYILGSFLSAILFTYSPLANVAGVNLFLFLGTFILSMLYSWLAVLFYLVYYLLHKR